MLDGIHWLGHASFRIELGGMVVYIDPWNLKHPEKKILAENISASMKGIKQSVKIREEKGYSVDPKLEYLYEENEVME